MAGTFVPPPSTFARARACVSQTYIWNWNHGSPGISASPLRPILIIDGSSFYFPFSLSFLSFLVIPFSYHPSSLLARVAWICMSYLACGQDEFQSSRNPVDCDWFIHRRGRTCLRCDELFILKGWPRYSGAFEDSRLNLFRVLRPDNGTVKCYLHDIVMTCNNILFRLYVLLICDAIVSKMWYKLKLFKPIRNYSSYI